MNFFAHALLAAEHNADPAYVLGSMLPDFCTMAGVKPDATGHALVDAGIDAYQAIQPVEHIEEIKELFGDRITLWGGVCTDTLGRGTPERVQHEALPPLCFLATPPPPPLPLPPPATSQRARRCATLPTREAPRPRGRLQTSAQQQAQAAVQRPRSSRPASR